LQLGEDHSVGVSSVVISSSASALTPTSAPLSRSLHAQADEPSRHRCRALPRGRASSPSHRSPPNLGHSSALDLSTSSTSCLSQLHGGKGTLLAYFRSELTGASPPSRSTVASSPLPFSSFSDLRPHFLNQCGCSWLDVTAGNCPGETERPAGALCAGRARHGRRWQTSTASLVMTVSALPNGRMGIASSHSTPLDHVALYLSIARPERWPRRSALCAAATWCTCSGLSVAPPSLLSTLSSLPSLADPFPSLSCHSRSPEMTGARQPTSAVRHERR
jgi:hypothetical protein